MSCDEVAAILELRDETARPDRAALGAHLDACPRCAAAYPEVGWLLASRPATAVVSPTAARRHRRRVLSTAAAIVAIVTLGAVVAGHHAEPCGPPKPGLPPPGRLRELPASASTLEHIVVVTGRDRQITSRWSESVWTPPPPRLRESRESVR